MSDISQHLQFTQNNKKQFKLFGISLLPLAVATLIACIGACSPPPKASRADAIAYNNRLTQIWNQAIEIDEETDIDFYNNYYSFFAPDDTLFVAFIDQRTALYDSMIVHAQNTASLNEHNELKTCLIEALQAQKAGLKSYYTSIIALPANDTTQTKQLLTQHNTTLNAMQQRFVNCQQKLSASFSFTFDN